MLIFHAFSEFFHTFSAAISHLIGGGFTHISADLVPFIYLFLSIYIDDFTELEKKTSQIFISNLILPGIFRYAGEYNKIAMVITT